MSEYQVKNEVTRQQANSLMWAQAKPFLWSLAAGACFVAAALIAGGVLLPGAAWLALLPAATGVYSLFKEWQSDTELVIKAKRVESNIESTELAGAFKTVNSPEHSHNHDQHFATTDMSLKTGVTAQDSILPANPEPSGDIIAKVRGDGKTWAVASKEKMLTGVTPSV